MNKCLYISFAVAFSLAAASCSVKEDRSVCPGYLHVNVPEDSRIETPVGMVGWNGSEELFRHSQDVYTDGYTWVKPLHKEDFMFLSYTGVRNSIDYENKIIIPVGFQSDSLYAYHEAVSLDEQYFVDVSFKKQFATVRVDMLQSPEGLAALNLTATAGTCGFDVVDYAPIEGPFMYKFNTDGVNRIASFRVPRQKDDSLKLSIDAPDGSRHLCDIDLGKKILDQGYSWETEELQDIFITFDFQYGVYTIAIADWETGEFGDGITYLFIIN